MAYLHDKDSEKSETGVGGGVSNFEQILERGTQIWLILEGYNPNMANSHGEKTHIICPSPVVISEWSLGQSTTEPVVLKQFSLFSYNITWHVPTSQLSLEGG